MELIDRIINHDGSSIGVDTLFDWGGGNFKDRLRIVCIQFYEATHSVHNYYFNRTKLEMFRQQPINFE